MSRLMQMAELMIRGGIATQTMKNLTKDQIDEINLIVESAMLNPDITADRVEVCRQLANTIGSDYRSDKDAGLQEFRIAIWRATVYLLHHRKYDYNCALCGATEYKTSNKTTKVFDRQYLICPACGGTYHNGAQHYMKKAPDGSYILMGANGDIVFPTSGGCSKTTIEEIVNTPINVIFGQKKYDNPYEILNDPTQKRKWYKTWVWNYFKQILNENLIKTHNKHQTEICGPADEIVIRSIINELKRTHRKFYFDESSYYTNSNRFEIFTNTYQTPPEFTNFLVMLKVAYEQSGVNISVDKYSVAVDRFNAPIVSAVVIEEDSVMMAANSPNPNSDDEDCESWIDTVEYNSHYDYDGNIHKVESDDLMQTIRAGLQDSKAKMVFDIYSQNGQTWEEFSDTWGEQPACKSHIAQFLDINVKEVEDCREAIKTQCLLYDLN